MNDKEVYVITTGEYSDYSICAIFSTKEKAKDYIQQNGSEYRVEKYNIDEEVPQETKLWLVCFDIDKSCIETAIPCDNRCDNGHDRKDTCKVNSGYYIGNRCVIDFYVDADKMDRAIKIARERFAAIKANEYIWIRLTRPYDIGKYGHKKYETFNVKTNEFTKL